MIFSERELIARPSVCRLSSVTLVHPTQAIEIFRNVSTPFGTLAICDLSITIFRNPPFPSISSTLHSPFLRSRAPLIQLGGLGSAESSPSGVRAEPRSKTNLVR